jgi:cephalosporin-C deacetylase
MKKCFLWIILSLMSSMTVLAQVQLPVMWKFHQGDDLNWSQSNYDDSSWEEIDPLENWEGQMLPNYDGYGWYRTRVFIPSDLKAKAEKFEGFMLHMGKIDDVDVTWFNGNFLGSTGIMPPAYESAWDQQRQYEITLDRVLWDQYNTIAVRVFDSTGGGGLYGGPVEISLLGLVENIHIVPHFTQTDHIFKESDKKEIIFSIANDLKFSVEGSLRATIVSDFGQTLADTVLQLKLRPKKKNLVVWPLKRVEPGFYMVKINFSNEEFSKKEQMAFGVEPEKIVSPPNPQPDFDAYWQRAKNELAAVDPQFKVIRMDSLCNDRRNVYLVEMRSLGNVLIRGWYSVPVREGVYPAVLLVQGYSSTIFPEFVDYGDDIIGFGLNIRGHGNSKDNINPGFPGYLQYQLHDKEQYIYRGAFMDCVRAVDFLYSRPEVDKKRVGVEGGSQGGALTFATAALSNDRIAVCVPQVPFLSDFEDYFKVARWPADEFTELVEEEKTLNWQQVFYTLSYIDIKNLASRIKAPMLMAVGLVDDVCPPHINFAAFNQVKSTKEYIVYPQAGHGIPRAFDARKMEFIRTKFGLTK